MAEEETPSGNLNSQQPVYNQNEDPNPHDDRIFVFGSNERGIHGAGAALFAKLHRGAQEFVGCGLRGRSYAIPTKNRAIVSRSLSEIKVDVDVFIEFAKSSPNMRFQLTAIGCGLAGFMHEQIAPLFKGCPPNVDMPPEWEPYKHLYE